MDTVQIIIIVILLIIYIISEVNDSKRFNIARMVVFIIIFILLNSMTITINKLKSEHPCPQYELIQEEVYKLKQ